MTDQEQSDITKSASYSVSGLLLFRSGANFFSAFEKLIDGAHAEIHFQTYIFESDETGMRIAEALIRAASRNVKIFLLIDSFGSTNFSKEVLSRMEEKGIEVRWYGQFFSNGHFHIGRRLHRKLTVIDGQTAIVGGINISNNYNDVKGKNAWLDFAVVVSGVAARKLRAVSLQRWMKRTFRKLPKELKENISERKEQSHAIISVRQNDWLRRKNEVARSYMKMIRQSSKSITIVGGYFLPGGKVRRAIHKASARGVEIKIIVPADSDVALMHNATQYLYQWMLRNRVRIFEYKVSNVHGKVLIADKRLVSIGSYDLNNLSTYSNIELNLDIHDDAFASAFHLLLEDIMMKDCVEVKRDAFVKQKRVSSQLLQWFSYQLAKTFFVLAVWLANRKDDDEYQ